MIEHHGKCFKVMLLLSFSIFIVYVIEYPVESSKFYLGTTDFDTVSEVQGDAKLIYKNFIPEEVNATELLESSLPTLRLARTVYKKS